jgi:Mg2+ and Co2+ transporter CorA
MRHMSKIEEDAEKVAENTFVKLGARIILILALPAAGLFGRATLNTLTDLRDDQQAIALSMVEIQATLTKGIEPRILNLEKEVDTIKNDLIIRTVGRFDKGDAENLEGDMRREVARLEKQIVGLKDLLEKLRNRK